MENPVLNNPDQYPSEDVIFSVIKERKALWIHFFEYLHLNHPDFSEEWRFYKDGKSWLMKIVRKSKTVFWLSLIEGGFRITFYFTDKFEEAIFASEISDELKDNFKNGKHYGKIRGLTITFNSEKEIEYSKSIIQIKLAK
jgi:hypothetical protein